ncbi:MAG: 30S ribosomal protein S20 [Acidimicrobiales bacterium]
MIDVLRMRSRSISLPTIPTDGCDPVPVPDTLSLRSQPLFPQRCDGVVAGIIEVDVANIKSQIKRNRQTEKRNLRNRKVRSELHTRTKTALTAIDEGENAEEAVKAAIKRIDKAAQKGLLKKNTAARRKSRLMRRLNAAS